MHDNGSKKKHQIIQQKRKKYSVWDEEVKNVATTHKSE